MNGKEILLDALTFAKGDYQKNSLSELSPEILHNVISKAIVKNLTTNWNLNIKKHLENKKASYFSAEFLVGRAVYNNLLCLNILDDVKKIFEENNLDLNSFEEIEDMALGNGGLGRLASCFLDSAATLDLPLDGYGIRYGYGLFKQKIENGFQIEQLDDWAKFGDPWSIRKENESVLINFSNEIIKAVPYDMPIIGYGTNHISTLRLWQSEPVTQFDFNLFNQQDYIGAFKEKNSAENISRILYPNDSTTEGKELRLKQQYFFSSASLIDIIKKYKEIHGNDFSKFADFNVIQLNDTHPVISIPEFIRLLEIEGVNYLDALEITKNTFAYTNHTVLPEALEKWDKNLIKNILPEIYNIIEKINNSYLEEMKSKNINSEIINRNIIIEDNLVHMARLAIFGSKFTNGVARIHTEILKETIFKDFYNIYPEKFQNKTNGITQRRWFALCNQELSSYYTELLGNDNWKTDLTKLKNLNEHLNNTEVINNFIEIKKIKKQQLADFIEKKENTKININSIFDVQVKRIHEYKRQFLNVLGILYLYYEIKDGNLKDFYPTTFIFGGKSAPGYERAKGIIKLINEISNLIENDSEVNDKIKIIFVSNYNVSYGEKIFAAADVSEQISTAGTEASGTGNMKFMLNGAVTIGTLDGANVEIIEEAGIENNYIFGATIEEIKSIENSYNPNNIYNSDKKIKRVLDTLINGTLNDNDTGMFKDLFDSILKGASWHKADHYYLLHDLNNYVETKIKINNDYKNKEEFGKKCLANSFNSGKFSSDRTIQDYADNIWKIEKIK